MGNKPILCLDFDGTISSYTSGWQGADIIPDEPIHGAFDFIQKAMHDFDVQIYSARSGLPGGIKGMQSWFIRHGWPESSPSIPEGLGFPTTKPPAFVSLDDRAITFTGQWPDIEQLKDFKPWHGEGV
jgi:hypothetical protein